MLIRWHLVFTHIPNSMPVLSLKRNSEFHPLSLEVKRKFLYMYTKISLQKKLSSEIRRCFKI